MPLPDAYEEQIKSKIADLVNVGPRAGGAITAALFLGHFVDKVPHAHVDIDGTGRDMAWGRRGDSDHGGLGRGTRAAASDFGDAFGP